VKYVLDMTRPYDNLLAAKGTNQPSQNFVWGGSLLSASEGNESTHYLNDHLGSPIRLLDGSVDSGDSGHGDPFAYDVFGEQIVAPSVAQPFGFAGYQTDAVSGMQYAQARYYDSAVARFASVDVLKGYISTPASLNSYVYCVNNPLGHVDLDGNAHEPYVIDDNVTGGYPTRTDKSAGSVNKHGYSSGNYGAAILLTDTGGNSIQGGPHNIANPFGHSALAIQTLYGAWWIMDWREVGDDDNKATVVFAPLENIVFGPCGQSIVSADFDFPGRAPSDDGFNVNRYNNQLFMSGDFSASWDIAYSLSGTNPGFNILLHNCIWLALSILQASTVGTSAYRDLDVILWEHRSIPTVTSSFPWIGFELTNMGIRNLVIPNIIPQHIERIMRDAGFPSHLTRNVHAQNYSEKIKSLLKVGALGGSLSDWDISQACE